MGLHYVNIIIGNIYKYIEHRERIIKILKSILYGLSGAAARTGEFIKE